MSKPEQSTRSIKSTVADLAIFGGTPAFAEALHVGRPNIGDKQRLAERIDDILERRWLTNDGRYVKELEQRIADFVGVKHCIAMCNATVALEIAIRALELKGEVIVPSFTFVATAHALQWQQIVPVFCDIDSETHNIDPTRVEELITKDTTGIIGVHVWGRACDTDALSEVARRNNLRLIYDAAHAFACSHQGRMIGGFGDAEVFSFHATKFFNTFEGGAVTTNDDELATKIRLMKNFGFAGYDQVTYIGTNGKMSEVSGAMGLTSLESLTDFIETNRVNYQHYRNGLAAVANVSLLTFAEDEKYNYQYVVMMLGETGGGLSRDQLVEVLHAENVIARRYFYPGCHRMEPYRSEYPDAGLKLPITESLAERVVVLPTGTAVSSQQISDICDLIKWITANGAEVHDRLEGRERLQ